MLNEQKENLNNLLAYVTSLIPNQTPQNLKKNFNLKSDGVAMIVSMINEQKKSNIQKLFLNHLKEQVHKNKLPEAFYLFSLLLLFFKGQSEGVQLPVDSKKSMSVKEFLAQTLDIQEDFFDSLITYFTKDPQVFASLFLKSKRISLALKESNFNVSDQRPIMSFLKVPDQMIISLVNLVQGKQFSTSFFSKELSISPQILDFFQLLRNIQQNSQERQAAYVILNQQNSSINQFLEENEVKGSELMILLQLMFGDQSEKDVFWLISGLNLERKMKDEEFLRDMLMMDRSVVIKKYTPEEIRKEQDKFSANKFIRKLELDYKLTFLLKNIIIGNYLVFEEYFRHELSYLNNPLSQMQQSLISIPHQSSHSSVPMWNPRSSPLEELRHQIIQNCPQRQAAQGQRRG